MTGPEGGGEALIRLAGVDLGYGRRRILSGVDLTIRRHEFLGIVGPNGSGKTTLLKGILGALRPLAGERVVHASPGPRFGYVPQIRTMNHLFPLTALDLVLMGTQGDLPAGRRPGPPERRRAREALERVAADKFATRPWQELSGGQQQRLLIARALAAAAEVLILDEPTNGMDLRAERQIMDLLRDLHREGGLAILIVSHLLNLVADAVHTLAILHHGQVSVGERDAILTGAYLEKVYGIPVAVEQVRGRRIVLPAGDPGQGAAAD